MPNQDVRLPCLVQVPFMCGDGVHLASAGPRRCAEAVRERLGARGVAFETAGVDVVAGVPGGSDASWRVNDRLASTVRRAAAAGQLPLVLAGSCDASLGVLAGVDHARCGVVWLDAHGDFNTPESSESGFFPGVDLDAFDPEVAPGIVDEPVPGGLSLRDGELIVRAVLERFRVRAATVATYVPARDREGRTLDLQLRLIELLAGG